jgi:hypothetical protein
MGGNRIVGGRMASRAWIVSLATLLAVLLPSAARAGDWMQVSCVNPNGSSAPSEGWTNFGTNTPEPGSNSSTACGPGSPMGAFLSSQAPAPVSTAGIGTSEDLQYTPPAGSELVGGHLDVNAYGDGYGPNANGTDETGSGDALMLTPDFAFGGVNVFFQCAWTLTTNCSPGAPDPAAYSGEVAVPAGRGGNFYVSAACGGATNGECDQNASGGAWASMSVLSSDFLLFNGSSPAASGFGGSLLSPDAYGTADVSFTAGDPGGPGVYNVTVKLDGNPVYDATPDTESGHCVAVGTDSASGALMFDYQQPCPTSEFVDVPVDTSALPDGEHQLVATVTDAAANTSTVLDQTITTRQVGTGSVSTPPPPPRRHRIKAKLLISWRYSGTDTRLLSVKARGLPHGARISIRCTGHGCPRHSSRTATATRVKRLWTALASENLSAGDREIITITAPGHTSERIELLIRDDKGPLAKVL